MANTVKVLLANDAKYYIVSSAARGFWLSIEKLPLPIPPIWRRSGVPAPVIMRGRCYWRLGTSAPLVISSEKQLDQDDELVRDYTDAAWWSQELEEAWVENQGLHEALEEMRHQLNIVKSQGDGPNARRRNLAS